jgi:hypothetical protein
LIDETSAKARMKRIYGRSLIGTRLIDKVPVGGRYEMNRTKVS